MCAYARRARRRVRGRRPVRARHRTPGTGPDDLPVGEQRGDAVATIADVDRHVVEHGEQAGVEEVPTEATLDEEREERGTDSTRRQDVGPDRHAACTGQLARGPHRNPEVRVEVLSRR